MTSRAGMFVLCAGALGATVAGYAWAVFAALGSAATAITGFAVWHLLSPARERAHLRYRQRVAARPKPASQWQHTEPAPEPVTPVRDDLLAKPGRRMVALLDEPVKQAPG